MDLLSSKKGNEDRTHYPFAMVDLMQNGSAILGAVHCFQEYKNEYRKYEIPAKLLACCRNFIFLCKKLFVSSA